MKHDEGLKRGWDDLAEQGQAFIDAKPSGSGLQHGLKKPFPTPESNIEILLSEQAKEEVPNVQVSFRIHDLKEKYAEPVTLALHPALATPFLHSQLTRSSTAGKLHTESFLSA